MKKLQIIGLALLYVFVGMLIKASFFPHKNAEVDFQWFFGSLVPGIMGILCLACAMYIEKKQKQKSIFKQSW